MNQKAAVLLEVNKNDHLYQFVMPVGAPFGEAYDAAYEVLNVIVQMAKEAAEKAKPSTPEQPSEVDG